MMIDKSAYTFTNQAFILHPAFPIG